MQNVDPVSVNFVPRKIRDDFKKINERQPWLKGRGTNEKWPSKSPCPWLRKHAELTSLLDINLDVDDSEEAGNFTTMVTDREFVTPAQVEQLLGRRKTLSSDETLVLAPSENQRPLDLWMDKFSEEKGGE